MPEKGICSVLTAPKAAPITSHAETMKTFLRLVLTWVTISRNSKRWCLIVLTGGMEEALWAEPCEAVPNKEDCAVGTDNEGYVVAAGPLPVLAWADPCELAGGCP